jgi:hexosaminidase
LQANVWTEYIGNEPTVEYMLLPRLCAMAEVLWSPAAAKDWDSFLQRLPVLFAHFDAAGLRYRPLG